MRIIDPTSMKDVVDYGVLEIVRNNGYPESQVINYNGNPKMRRVNVLSKKLNNRSMAQIYRLGPGIIIEPTKLAYDSKDINNLEKLTVEIDKICAVKKDELEVVFYKIVEPNESPQP